jgi:hypothetical protein
MAHAAGEDDNQEAPPTLCANFASVLVLHGAAAKDAAISKSNMRLNPDAPHPLHKHSVTWNPRHTFVTASAFHCNGYERSGALVSNGQGTLPLLQRTFHKAKRLFEVGAYVHQYKEAGLEKDEFVEAFQNMSSIIGDYQQLSSGTGHY